MTNAGEMILIAIGALLAGLLIPLLLQTFLTLRALRRALGPFERRSEEVLRELGDVVTALKRISSPVSGASTGSAPVESMSTMVAALVPAVVAGVRAFRQSSPARIHQGNGVSQDPTQEVGA